MHFILQLILPLNPQDWNESSDLCSGCCSAGPLLGATPSQVETIQQQTPLCCAPRASSVQISLYLATKHIYSNFTGTQPFLSLCPLTLWQRLGRGDGCSHVHINLSLFFIKLSKIISSLQNVFPFHPSLGGWSKPPHFNI